MIQDLKLQLALAKMLPNKLSVARQDNGKSFVVWLPEGGTGDRITDELCCTVQDTEWLHVCWLVEHTLEFMEHCKFRQIVQDATGLAGQVSANWQLRATALAKVKGIDI